MGKLLIIETSKKLLDASPEELEKIARKFTKEELEFFCEHPAFENFGFNAKLPEKPCVDGIVFEKTIDQTYKKMSKNNNNQNIKDTRKMLDLTNNISKTSKEFSIKELIEMYGEDFKLSDLPKGIKIKKNMKAKDFQNQNKKSLKNREIIIV